MPDIVEDKLKHPRLMVVGYCLFIFVVFAISLLFTVYSTQGFMDAVNLQGMIRIIQGDLPDMYSDNIIRICYANALQITYRQMSVITPLILISFWIYEELKRKLSDFPKYQAVLSGLLGLYSGLAFLILAPIGFVAFSWSVL